MFTSTSCNFENYISAIMESVHDRSISFQKNISRNSRKASKLLTHVSIASSKIVSETLEHFFHWRRWTNASPSGGF